MKIGKIAKLCKSKKIITIFEHEGEQWIGDGYGMYLLDCEQKLDTNSLLTIFDVEPAKRAEWRCVHTNAPKIIELDNDNATDMDFEEFSIGLQIHDEDLVVGRAGEEIVMFPNRYLSPIRESDYMRVFVRTCEGAKFIVVKEGFLIKAALTLVRLDNMLAITELGEIVRWFEKQEAKNPQTTFDDLMEEARG